MNGQVSWWSVHEFVDVALARVGSWPTAGTPAWVALPDDHPAKIAALFDAAQHHALRLELNQEALAEASKAISSAADWSSVAAGDAESRGVQASAPVGSEGVVNEADLIAQGREIALSGKHTPPPANGNGRAHVPVDPAGGDDPDRWHRKYWQRAGMISAADLDKKTFPPMRWHVPGLVPEGLGLLVAPPKAGKSWMVAGVGLACAAGGKAFGCIDVEPRPVLYMALEDGERRLQDRHRILLGDDEKKPDNMHLHRLGHTANRTDHHLRVPTAVRRHHSR